EAAVRLVRAAPPAAPAAQGDPAAATTPAEPPAAPAAAPRAGRFESALLFVIQFLGAATLTLLVAALCWQIWRLVVGAEG
ncbi:MAG: hypothetical protein JNK46_00510, partial [Methylobacteriaceae bacterium]|nr:hypothetical protein [Methylobacteriaceae bacterium]